VKPDTRSGASPGQIRLSRHEFPDKPGLSRSDVKYVRQMAGAWTEQAVDQRPVGQLPWGHITVLPDKLDDQAQRDWHAAAAEHGWSAEPPVYAEAPERWSRRLACSASDQTGQLSDLGRGMASRLIHD